MNGESRPLTRHAGDGEVAWLVGFPHTIKLSGSDTDGAVCVVECDAPRDAGTPVHVHHRDDETFYVLDGELTFFSDDETISAPAGTLVHLRRGVRHAFTVESERARFLVLGTPAVQDAFFRAAGTPARQEGPPDLERLHQAAESHGIELLGPPPG